MAEEWHMENPLNKEEGWRGEHGKDHKWWRKTNTIFTLH